MRATARLTSSVLLCCLTASAGAQEARRDADTWVNPVIKDYGKAKPFPQATAQPERGRTYRALFNVVKAADKPDKVNPGLDHVARLINIYGMAGVQPANLRLTAIVHGPATDSVLADKHYRTKHRVDNPNTKLIAALKRAGVEVLVCGQALAHAGFDSNAVDPEVTVALAALTVLPIYQQNGYALIPE